MSVIKIHPKDNVAVAMSQRGVGAPLDIDGVLTRD
jgi:hypothetical protein